MDGQEFSDRAVMALNKNKLAWAEGEIIKSMNHVGKMLKEIHDKAYWKNGEYDSFEDYCRKRWDMGKSRSYQLLQAENTKLMLSDITKGDLNKSTIVETLNASKLIELSKVEPAQAIEIVVEASKDGKPTAKKIRERLPKNVKDRIVTADTVNPVAQPWPDNPSEVLKNTCPSCGHSF